VRRCPRTRPGPYDQLSAAGDRLRTVRGCRRTRRCAGVVEVRGRPPLIREPLLSAATAALIGGTSLQGGIGSALGIAVGAPTIRFIVSGLAPRGAPFYVEGLTLGMLSFFGKVGHAGSAAYGGTKAVVHALTISLAMELAPHGAAVNALCPGLAATGCTGPSWRRTPKRARITLEEMKKIELQQIPLHRYGAGAIMWLASESGPYVTGQCININGGLDFTRRSSQPGN
jgi:NAD(P)-dependent dehydrogenase (short-subunit alcohol dehydrogenase family)